MTVRPIVNVLTVEYVKWFNLLNTGKYVVTKLFNLVAIDWFFNVGFIDWFILVNPFLFIKLFFINLNLQITVCLRLSIV